MLIFSMIFSTFAYAADNINFDNYLTAFDNAERRDMKIGIPEMLELHKNGLAQIVDVRTEQEHRDYSYGFMKHIPLNELPKRINELDMSKNIIFVCQFSERAVIARMFLKLKGYKAKYLTSGISGIKQYFRENKF